MIGLQRIIIQKKLATMFKLILVILVLLLVLTGCSLHWLVGDGRGDWREELSNGYAVIKVNSYEIVLGHQDRASSPGWSTVITNFYVTAYQQNTPYIFIEGFHTEDTSATSAELENHQAVFYLVDTETNEIVGPFESKDDFIAYCSAQALEVPTDWEMTANHKTSG